MEIGMSYRILILVLALLFSAVSIFFLINWYETKPYPIGIFASLNVSTDHHGARILKGHVMGSGQCVGEIEERRYPAELNLVMRQKILCPFQESGDFSYKINGTVEKVTFGVERHAIPSR